jgi:hypothetical protein
MERLSQGFLLASGGTRLHTTVRPPSNWVCFNGAYAWLGGRVKHRSTYRNRASYGSTARGDANHVIILLNHGNDSPVIRLWTFRAVF